MAACQVSIITVTHNSESVLPDFLSCLPAGLGGLTYELIVVDNESDTDPTPAIKAAFPEATIIRRSHNVGFGAACNEGAGLARGEHLLFLNPDVTVDPGALGWLDQALRRDLRAGAVGGRLRFPDGTFQPTCRRFPTVSNMIFSRGSALGKLFRVNTRYTLPDYETMTEVPAVAATMMMIRRDLFRRLRGFDRSFFMYMEDTDLCQRLVRRRRTNYFVPAAGGVHRWAEGGRAGRMRRAWWHHNSVWKYFIKHVPNAFSLVILPLFLTLNWLLILVVGSRQGGDRSDG